MVLLGARGTRHVEGALGHFGEHPVHGVASRRDLLLAELDHFPTVCREGVAEEAEGETDWFREGWGTTGSVSYFLAFKVSFYSSNAHPVTEVDVSKNIHKRSKVQRRVIVKTNLIIIGEKNKLKFN